MDQLLGHGPLGHHVYFGRSAVVPFLTCLHCNGLLFPYVFPPLRCGDQLACLREGGDTCVPLLEMQMSEVSQPWRDAEKKTGLQIPSHHSFFVEDIRIPAQVLVVK